MYGIAAYGATKFAGEELPIKRYSRGAVDALPTDTADLATVYTVGDVVNAADDDAVRVSLVGVGGKYLVHLFKYNAPNATYAPLVSWNGQCAKAPSTATVYLQIYNWNTAAWEALANNAAATANTDFTLQGAPSGTPANYYGAAYQVAIRVYQLV